MPYSFFLVTLTLQILCSFLFLVFTAWASFSMPSSNFQLLVTLHGYCGFIFLASYTYNWAWYNFLGYSVKQQRYLSLFCWVTHTYKFSFFLHWFFLCSFFFWFLFRLHAHWIGLDETSSIIFDMRASSLDPNIHIQESFFILD